MAAQTLKCRRKTVMNESNENSFDITNKSGTTLTLIEVWTLLNTPLKGRYMFQGLKEWTQFR